MTQPEHTPTEQETLLYDHMTAGEWDEIAELRTATEPDELEQFDEDHQHAWAHYQADHEPSEADREKHTKDKAEKDNKDQKDKEPKPKAAA